MSKATREIRQRFILGMKSADGDQRGKKAFSHVMKPANAIAFPYYVL